MGPEADEVAEGEEDGYETQVVKVGSFGFEGQQIEQWVLESH